MPNRDRVRARKLAIQEAARRGMTCYHCKIKITVDINYKNSRKYLTADHYPIPKIMGGKSVPNNIVASCQKCNNKDGTRLVASTPCNLFKHRSNFNNQINNQGIIAL